MAELVNRGYIVKEVGETGGLGLPDDPDTRWLSFAVDDIAENEVCANPSEQPLHVPTKVDVSIATMDIPDDLKPLTGSIFTPGNWQWVLEDGTTSGVMSQDESVFAYACGNYSQLSAGLAPNSQYRVSFYLDIPEGATDLILHVDGSGWEWELP